MATDLIRYDLLVQEALKGVVRRILVDAARDGLPGEHHFYVSFRTDHPGVRLSPRLREKYPQDMTIVLQHQYDELTIGDQAFEVGLSFSGVAERLRIPFEALTGFFDPSVQFGLKFEQSETEEESEEEVAEAPEPIPINPRKAGVPALARSGKAAKDGEGGPKAEPKGKGAKAKEPDGDGAAPTAEVVSLDSFRKKN